MPHAGELPTVGKPLNLSASSSSQSMASYPAAIHIDKCERERQAIEMALSKESAISIRILLCHFHALAAWEENLLSKFEDTGPRDELRACMKVALNSKVN